MVQTTYGCQYTIWQNKFLFGWGSHMKKLVIASAAIAAFCFVNPANAADLAVKAPALLAVPAFNWTGFYIGVDGGYTWGRSTSFQPGSVISFSASPDPRGGIFGVHGGYRYQLDNRFVLGLEGNFDWMTPRPPRRILMPPAFRQAMMANSS